MRAKSNLLEDREVVGLHHAVAVVDGMAKTRSELVAALRPVNNVEHFPTIDAFDEANEPGDPMVIVFGPSMVRPENFDHLTRLLRSRPELKAVIVVDRLAASMLQQAIRVGVSDVVDRADVARELREAVVRADQGLITARAGYFAPPDESGGQVGRVTTVFSPKGGSGKSMVATNLAVALTARSNGPVVLIDADLQFGDDAVMLHMHPKHTIADVVDVMDRLDLHLLRSMLSVHEPSGVLLLAAPTEPAMADKVTSTHMSVIINLCRSFASHIVIDTPSTFDDIVINVLDRSDDIVIVGGMDIPTIKNVKIGLQTLGMLEIPSERMHLVLNRANTKVKVEVQEVERTLQMRADALIPSDILVPTSINKGVAAVLDVPRSGVARSIGQLADVLRNRARPQVAA